MVVKGEGKDLGKVRCDVMGADDFGYRCEAINELDHISPED